MNKTDKNKIAESWRNFQAGAARCANTCYNLAQSDEIPERHRKTMGEAVRAHDAARNHFITTLEQFGILPESQRPSSNQVGASPPSTTAECHSAFSAFT